MANERKRSKDLRWRQVSNTMAGNILELYKTAEVFLEEL